MEQNKILIVDDLEDNLRVIGSILNDLNIILTVARNGKDAIKSAIKKTPDLIILDISMPDMDGFEVCKELKNNIITKEMPIIFLTALSQTEDIVKGFNVGAADYVVKPFQKEELLARVNVHLNLKKSKDTINLQNKILEEKNQAIELQKNKIEKQHNEILSSIRYAQQIQSFIQPNEKFLQEIFAQSFLFFQPKDIVSGDFFWIKKKNNIVQFAVADATGHGVPGAIMSILVTSMLNEITSSENIIPVNVILYMLREKFSETKTNGINQEYFIQDGVDIALGSIDLNHGDLNFSGAYNSIIIVRKNISSNKFEIIEFKGDKNIISFAEKSSKLGFTSHNYKLTPGDRLFLFTDGYYDQFGGPKKKKILRKNFRQLILETTNYPIFEQKKIISQYFGDWKNGSEQTDDAMVLGLQFQY